MTTNNDLSSLQLEEELLSILDGRPLDDIIDALEGAFRRRASDIPDPSDADFYRNAAVEIHELKERDFELSTEASSTVQ